MRYPAGVQEAVARIRQAHPDAVTINEACGGDVALIARQTGYHARFSSVIYYGKPLRCIRPGGRGLFGDAVLTRAAIERTESYAFRAQAGPEQRQWLCVSTRVGVDVCTAHLASHEPVEAAANDPQCAELTSLLARRASARTVIFGGDVNRLVSCAPHGFWTRADSSAHQDPGSQQVYGAGALRSPSARVEPATHTDHDVLLVSASSAHGAESVNLSLASMSHYYSAEWRASVVPSQRSSTVAQAHAPPVLGSADACEDRPDPTDDPLRGDAPSQLAHRQGVDRLLDAAREQPQPDALDVELEQLQPSGAIGRRDRSPDAPRS